MGCGIEAVTTGWTVVAAEGSLGYSIVECLRHMACKVLIFITGMYN